MRRERPGLANWFQRFCDSGLWLDIYSPAGEFRGQPGVLPLFADGERQLAVGHDDGACVVQVIDLHREDLGGAERICDEPGRLRVPLDHVDPFTIEFVDDVLDAYATQADA